MKVGILSVQGAFIEHKKILESLGIECIEIRKRTDVTENKIDGLIFPGGESTVQGKLVRDLDLFEPLKSLIESDVPVLATCAGLILLSEKISEDSTVHFGTLPVIVKRNAYGRQLGSFTVNGEMSGIGKVEMIFIRAPYVQKVNNAEVKILSTVEDRIVAVQFRNQLALSFHPELGKDDSVHRYFIQLIKKTMCSLVMEL